MLIYYIFAFVSITIFLSIDSSAQILVSRVEINPLNRAILYCSEQPRNFKSQLSPDKKKIIINLINANVEEKARKAAAQGIIQDVYIQKFGSDLQVNVILKDRRGYTVFPLEYSQAIAIEVFRWEDVDAAEDAYREGLLALESSMYKPAKENFIKAVKNDHPNAAALLAIMLLKEGRTSTAYKLLRYADDGGSNIPDLNACLSQIYSDRGDKTKAEIFAKKFAELTKKESFPLIMIPDEYRIDSLVETELANIISIKQDSIYASNDDSTTNNATNTQFPNIFSKDSTNEAKDYGLKIFPDFSPLTTVFLIIIFVSFAVFLAISYFRWRKKQIEKIQRKVVKQNREKVIETIETLTEKNKKEKETYKEALVKKDEALKKEREKRKKTEVLALESEIELLKKEKTKPSLADRVEDIANKIIEEKRRESGDNKIDTPSLPAKVELALHLQQEQNKLKRKNLENIDDKLLNANPKKLAETAKKLGIDVGMLETKQAIENIIKNKDSLDEFSKKFKEKK